MRSRLRSTTSPYEVRCPRCDVSFPVETRTCIHCGGPTSQPGGFIEMEDPAELVPPIERGGSVTRAPSAPADARADSPYEIREADPFGDHAAAGGDGLPRYEDDRAYEAEHGPPSFVQSLMRSMGSLIWIVILIAFSLSRSCGN